MFGHQMGEACNVHDCCNETTVSGTETGQKEDQQDNKRQITVKLSETKQKSDAI
jgi:hypothetical protein